MTQKLLIGITGASGIIYGIRLLQVLQETPIETHLIISKAAHLSCRYESPLSAKAIASLADKSYKVDDITACIASGSYKTLGMIIAPCSVRTLSDIAHSHGSNLLSRAADVTLKEGRKLVLMLRETPLHCGHIKNMAEVCQMGAIIAPPMPAFYNKPQSIDDIVNHSVGRVLDLFDIDVDLVKRWKDD